nr:uncharacterized protein LOC111420051 [Onthophagus taurus]
MIEARPALYMKNLKEYADVNVKRKLWQEICMEIIPNWGELSSENKIKSGQNVQQKWLNLRTCFCRELKAQKDVKSGQSASKRRKYIYFEKLMFLLLTIEQRPTESNIPQEETAEVEDHNLDEILIDTSIRTPTSSTKKKRRIQDGDTGNSAVEQEILKAVQQETDEDTHFALSLVSQLRSLSEDEKFEAKIDILKIFQQMKRRRSQSFRSTIAPQLPHASAIHQYGGSNPEPQQSGFSIIPSPAHTDDTIQSYVSLFTTGSSASEELLEL